MNAPAQRPGKSRQDYGTPQAFIDAVNVRFGPIVWDLAATRENCVVGAGDPNGCDCYFGPDHEQPEFRDSLKCDWPTVNGVLWLNPPFANIAPWAEKCASVRHRRGWTLLLTPASVGSNWFAEHVMGQALVLFLAPRLSFDGKASYPKDLALAAFGFGVVGVDRWDWRA